MRTRAALTSVVVPAALTLLLAACGGGGAIEGVEEFGKQDQGHANGTLSYAQAPPVGGQHNPQWMNCGVYDQQVPIEYAVHSMEHGAVWIAYQPNLAEADIERLRALARDRSNVLLSPYTYGGLERPITAVAWSVRLQTDKSDDPRLASFADKYAKGPTTPEPGAPCSGSFGSPVE